MWTFQIFYPIITRINDFFGSKLYLTAYLCFNQPDVASLSSMILFISCYDLIYADARRVVFIYSIVEETKNLQLYNFCIKYVCAHMLIPRKMTKVILLTGNCVFGIYLFEQFARIQLLPVYLFLCKYTVGVLACTVYVFSSFLLAYIYTLIAKKVPKVGNML